MRKHEFLNDRSIIIVSILFLLASCSNENTGDTAAFRQQISPGNTGVIVVLFEWRWDDVARECEVFLGPTGYSAVQVSSPLENSVVDGRPWWERYQPVSYTLDNRSGDREAFIDMVRRCRKVGVDIYVDTIINHMTGVYSGRGTAGSSFSEYSYPGLYEFDDFHHCGLTRGDDIEDWEDPVQVRNCELVDLADLDTAAPGVRSRISTYLNDLMEIGVRGFRIDAARHMPPGDIQAIFENVAGNPYVYQEVIDHTASQVWTREHAAVGHVTDFRYGAWLKDVFRERALSALAPDASYWSDPNGPASNPNGAGSDHVVVFLDNHDTQRHDALSFQDGALYDLANVFMLATPYGRPRVMSSYYFEDTSDGAPSEADGTILRVHVGREDRCDDTNWVCEHRRPAMAQMVVFRSATAASPSVTGWWSDGDDQIAFSRNGLGFVAINRSTEPMSERLQTGLPPGEYCDILSALPADQKCAGEKLLVNDSGAADIHVPAMSATAFVLERQAPQR